MADGEGDPDSGGSTGQEKSTDDRTTDGTNSADDGTGGWTSTGKFITGWSDLVLPGWLVSLKPLADIAGFLTTFAKNPRKAIFGFLSLGLADYLITGGRIVTKYTLIAFGIPVGETDIWSLWDIPGSLFGIIEGLITGLFNPLITLISSFNSLVADAAIGNLGVTSPLLRPVITTGIAFVEVFALGWIIITVITAVDIPGVRGIPLARRFDPRRLL